MAQIRMRVVTTAGRGLLFDPGVAPAIKGAGGDTDYLCGSCGVILVESAHVGVIDSGTTIVCPKCRSLNQLNGPERPNRDVAQA